MPEQLIILVVLLILGTPVALLIWALVRAGKALQRADELEARLNRLEREMALAGVAAPIAEPAPPKPITGPLPVPPVADPAPFIWRPTAEVAPGLAASPASAGAAPPIQPTAPPPKVEVSPVPPPIPPQAPVAKPQPSLPPKPAFNWEQFLGVKLFAWVGGSALFLAVVFFVKYSFDHNLITPEMRVVLGFLTGLGLVVGGVWLNRRFPVGAQTLCGTGVVILYATTFASRSFYHLVGTMPAFGVMVLVTAAAFTLAVRLDAQVVAVLGMLGGFLTPVLVSSGEDNPLGLFGYIALLDIGLLAVALRQRWHYLTTAGAAGTALMQAAWVLKFFEPEKYWLDSKIFIALAVFLAFCALFLAAWTLARRWEQKSGFLDVAAWVPVIAAAVFAVYMLGCRPLGERPGVIFGYVLVVELAVLALVSQEERFASLHFASGGVAFVLLGIWMGAYLTDSLLNWALGLTLFFAVLHAALPMALDRLRPGGAKPGLGNLFPLAALALLLIPILKLHLDTLNVWPVVLLLDLVVIALAVMSASLWWIAAALVLTALAAMGWIFQAPRLDAPGLDEMMVIGGIGAGFAVAAAWALRRLRLAGAESASASALDDNPLAALGNPQILPALTTVLPFGLLLLVIGRLSLADPSPVFGLALLLAVLVLGLSRILKQSWLPALALGCVWLVEQAWQQQHFKGAPPLTPLLWHIGFVLLFAAFPFALCRDWLDRPVPWVAAALAGPVHFQLVYRLVKSAWPNDYLGLLPVAFAVPAFAGLLALVRLLPAEHPKRLTLLAWFGGAALFFVTLIFPIQWERQWITIGWALEGVALLWLFHRIPHPGLRLTGVALLVTAFVRLAFNPAILAYQPRSATPIFNWYLYAYGLVTVALFAGARLLAPPRDRTLNVPAPPLLYTLGTVLAFLLLNLEIADYFTEAGSLRLVFEFKGSFARDMTYSIAWGGFALALLIVGLLKRLRAPRYAGLALLCVTLGKLFLHDLAHLGQLYRIGAFMGVAVIAIAASFLYQRFIAADLKANESKPPQEPPPAVPPAA